MSEEDTNLPIILVCAFDVKSADSVITEIIRDEEDLSKSSPDGRVWHINNKYYSAFVRFVAVADEPDELPHMNGSVEAHVVVINIDEEAEASAVWRRTARARRVSRGEVRLCVCGGAGGAALDEAARGARLELLTRTPALDDEDEQPWTERARDALQAHLWPTRRETAAAAGDGRRARAAALTAAAARTLGLHADLLRDVRLLDAARLHLDLDLDLDDLDYSDTE